MCVALLGKVWCCEMDRRSIQRGLWCILETGHFQFQILWTTVKQKAPGESKKPSIKGFRNLVISMSFIGSSFFSSNYMLLFRLLMKICTQNTIASHLIILKGPTKKPQSRFVLALSQQYFLILRRNISTRMTSSSVSTKCIDLRTPIEDLVLHINWI